MVGAAAADVAAAAAGVAAAADFTCNCSCVQLPLMSTVKCFCCCLKLCRIQASDYKLVDISDNVRWVFLLLEDPENNQHIAVVPTVQAVLVVITEPLTNSV